MYRVGNRKFRNRTCAVQYYGDVIVWILKKAVELTPIDTGRLINSYKIERYGDALNEVRIVNDCEYAIYVHEMDNMHVNGQAKFLEYAGWMAMQVFDGLYVSVELDEDYIALYVDDINNGIDITGKYEEFDNFTFGSDTKNNVQASASLKEVINAENTLLDNLSNLKPNPYYTNEHQLKTINEWTTKQNNNNNEFGEFLDMHLRSMEG